MNPAQENALAGSTYSNFGTPQARRYPETWLDINEAVLTGQGKGLQRHRASNNP